jgi:signal transduction histidine kinase
VRRVAAGRQGGQLLLAAGILTLVNNYLPGSSHLDLLVLNTVGVLACLVGLVCLKVPWDRLPVRAPLVVVVVAFTLLVVSSTFGGVGAYSYAVYYVVVFVWIGIAQPPWTSLWISPLAVVSYLLPFLLADDHPPTAIASVTVAVPVCVLVGEVLARQVAGLEQSRAALRSRVARVEQLAASAGELGSDLDVRSVGQRLVTAARELFGARAAALTAGGVVVAVDGLAPSAVGGPAEQAETAGGHVQVPCDDGALHLLLEPGQSLDPADLDLLRLLAAQGAAALVNARTHADVVARSRHEQAVVDVLADGVLVLGADGTVRSANEAAAALLDVPRAELVGTRPALEIGPPGVVRDSSIGTRWVETVATRLDGGPDGTGERVVALRDVSSHRALDEAKDLFLATTSHELRTPLTAIKGYVHVLQRRWEVLDDDRRREALATVAERTDALVALTDHLLLGARAGASRYSADCQPFELCAAIASALRGLQGLSGLHRLEADLSSAPLVAMGDPISVQQILVQLVQNAVKYSPEGGTVQLTAIRDGSFAVVEVADEGVGIPEDAGATLFAPFFQAGRTNTREFGGVGLGLYIVRQLVEAQGGSVGAANRAGGGTVVRFTVPLARSYSSAPAEAGGSGAL